METTLWEELMTRSTENAMGFLVDSSTRLWNQENMAEFLSNGKPNPGIQGTEDLPNLTINRVQSEQGALRILRFKLFNHRFRNPVPTYNDGCGC